MAITTPKSAFLHGLWDGAPFLLVVGPFAALFGLLATEAGLTVFETLTFSVAVIAGAAQLTAIQLMQENAPTIVVLASALAVNLRMALYSASLAPWIGADNVRVTYSRSGLGYVGRPFGAVSTVTVGLQGLTFDFLILDELLPGLGSITIPPHRVSATSEDLCSQATC